MKKSFRMLLLAVIGCLVFEAPSGIEAQRFPVESMGKNHVMARISSGLRSVERAHYEMEFRGQVKSLEVGLRGRYKYTRANGVLYLVRDIDPIIHLPLRPAGLAVGVTSHPHDLFEVKEPLRDVMYYLVVQPSSQHMTFSLGTMHSLYTSDDFWAFSGLSIHGKQFRMTVEGGSVINEETPDTFKPLVIASFFARLQTAPIGFRAAIIDVLKKRELRGGVEMHW
jgi:hypothetical protein